MLFKPSEALKRAILTGTAHRDGLMDAHGYANYDSIRLEFRGDKIFLSFRLGGIEVARSDEAVDAYHLRDLNLMLPMPAKTPVELTW